MRGEKKPVGSGEPKGSPGRGSGDGSPLHRRALSPLSAPAQAKCRPSLEGVVIVLKRLVLSGYGAEFPRENKRLSGKVSAVPRVCVGRVSSPPFICVARPSRFCRPRLGAEEPSPDPRTLRGFVFRDVRAGGVECRPILEGMSADPRTGAGAGCRPGRISRVKPPGLVVGATPGPVRRALRGALSGSGWKCSRAGRHPSLPA